MHKSATQRKYNQGTKAGNTIINILLNPLNPLKGTYQHTALQLLNCTIERKKTTN